MTDEKVEGPTLEAPVRDRVVEIPEEEVVPQDLERKVGYLRIVSDGTNTAVFDDLGRQIQFVISADWKVDAKNPPKATIELYKVPVDIICKDTKMKHRAAWGVSRTNKPVITPLPKETKNG